MELKRIKGQSFHDSSVSLIDHWGAKSFIKNDHKGEPFQDITLIIEGYEVLPKRRKHNICKRNNSLNHKISFTKMIVHIKIDRFLGNYILSIGMGES